MFNVILLVLQDENDVYILTKVSDILHSVFSSYKEKVLPWFEQLLQLIVQLIVSPVKQVLRAKGPVDGVGLMDYESNSYLNLSSVSQQAMGGQTVGSVHL